MLLQSFESPRKLRDDLGAGVCAGALLQGHGLAALVTNPKTRLLIQPLSGAGGTVIDVALEAVQEIAFLSKDVAVALDGDHILWALSDLGATVKAQKVARDVRALCARPSGESALALRIDGKVVSLTLNRGAVAARAFGLRGMLRACDVGEHVTYAVLDGKAGGQFRIHPGATPELGIEARVALPEGAARLDRVRGGQALSAVFKRGEATVCVVRGPSKLAVKLVELEAKPVDVAVLGGNLLVAFADGRLALYDREALDRAGDTPLAATSVVVSGGKGKPQVIFAVVTKAGPALWIGTSAGEVLSAALVANNEPAEVSVKARKNSAARANDAPAKESKVSPHSSAFSPAALAVDAALAAERDALRAELAQAKGEHATALTAREQVWSTQHEQALAALRRELSAVREAHAKELAAKEGAAAEVKRGAEALSAALGKARDQQRAAEERAAALERHLGAKGDEIDALKAKFVAAEEQYGVRTAERDWLKGELEAVRGKLQGVDADAQRYKEQLATKAEESDRLEGDVQDMQSKLGMANEQVRNIEAELASRMRELDAIQAEFDALQTELWSVQEHLRGREAELATRTAELAMRTAELTRRKGELDALEGRLSSAEEQLRGREAELATRTTERDGLKREIDRLAADLVRERERIERPSLLELVMDGRLSLKRARETLDALIAQLHEILFRRSRE
jgi:hypothetical protein